MNTTTSASRSAELFARAQNVLPGGVSRIAVLRSPHPLYVDRGEGCRVIDIDGVSRVDFSNNMASMIHGHACPEVVNAVTEQLARGTAFMMATEAEVGYAEHLCSRNPAFEMIRFVNSGTEAIMLAIKAARALTDRPMIAKVEGAYHGVYDYAEVSQASTPENWGSSDRPVSVPLVRGTPASATSEVLILPYNDIERSIALLDEHADRLACVLLDLMPHRVGLNPADEPFVRALREWTTRNGSLFVLDEVITFRSEHAGLQARYGVTPDLTALGKMIGGGFPIGAVAGRREVLEIMDPRSPKYRFPHSGTYTANPVSMAAGMATMTRFDHEAVGRLNTLADRAREGITDAIARSGVPGCVTGTGSMFRVHMKPRPPRNYREAYATPDEAARLQTLLSHLYDNGMIVIGTGACTLSTPMTEVEIDALIEAMASGFAKIASMG